MAPRIEEKYYGEGDTYLIRDVLPPDILDGTFERLCEEVKWSTMSHRGGEVPRLVAVQGTVDPDGTIPIYRHPSDASPPLLAFSPTVALIREHIQALLPPDHPPLNNVLIQRYRTGEDYISEHADKTVDIMRGSSIVNVSIGAQRRMTLRTKKNTFPEQTHATDSSKYEQHSPRVEREKQQIPLPHNSALVFGLETNRKWLHGIRRDGRFISYLTPAELAFDRERISLTFRSIGTFLSPVAGSGSAPQDVGDGEKWLIWGQGATGKTRDKAHPVSSSSEERQDLLYSFGKENHLSEFDWENAYGRGFDVLHLT